MRDDDVFPTGSGPHPGAGPVPPQDGPGTAAAPPMAGAAVRSLAVRSLAARPREPDLTAAGLTVRHGSGPRAPRRVTPGLPPPARAGGEPDGWHLPGTLPPDCSSLPTPAVREAVPSKESMP